MTNVMKSVKEMFTKNDMPFTAERAWIETTYGDGSYRTIEQRIKDKQDSIKRLIKSKFDTIGGTHTLSKDYRCVVDFEDDIKNNVDEVLAPFIEGGFMVINLSEQVAELSDSCVYLISWKKAFNKKN